MAADFMILGTPTYHGSYSGILKRVRFLEYGSLQNEANWINRQ